MYRIIFRTCDKVHSLHNATRPFGLDKRSLIKLCFISLADALEGFEHSIHIIADDISEDLRDFFMQYPVTFTNGTFGNDASIAISLEQAFSYDDRDWVYLVEDDYLHSPQAFLWIDDFIKERERILLTKPKSPLKRLMLANRKGELHRHPLFIHTPDYPDRYWPRDRKRSFIFLSKYCHWRQIANTTFTFLAEAKTFKRYRKQLERGAVGAMDGPMSESIYGRNHFFGKALCVSPIPGVATHMHEAVMTPFVDWKSVAERAEKLQQTTDQTSRVS